MAVAVVRTSNTSIGTNLGPVPLQKRGWGRAQRWERDPKGAGGWGKGTELKNVVLIDEVGDDGQRWESEKGAVGYDHCYEQWVPGLVKRTLAVGSYG